MDAHLKKNGFIQSNNDPCIYFKETGMYVDDIVIAGKTHEQLQLVKDALSEKFDIKTWGNCAIFLGMSLEQDEDSGSVWIGQPVYTENILMKFGMLGKPASTPVESGTKLRVASETDEFCGLTIIPISSGQSDVSTLPML